MPEPDAPRPAAREILLVGAHYPAARRGLPADLLAAAALSLSPLPVCTALVMATERLVTDQVEVPEDAVRAQLQHVAASASPAGAKLGVLAGHGAARAVLDAAEALDGPVVFDMRLSGPAGETLLPSRALTLVQDRLGVPDLLLLTRTDAELVSGGEIQSLDDAQVAVQRIVRRGARAVCIKCGHLPARHFEAPPAGDGAPEAFATDLLYDGHEFAVFEAPLLPAPPAGGTGSAFSMAALDALMRGESVEGALRAAKRFVSEALRSAQAVGGASGVDYFWEARRHDS
jgi:hydroxymethylpyrimidine/phosphomethylpyrimidine kinase